MQNMIGSCHCRHKYLNDMFFRIVIQRNTFTLGISNKILNISSISIEFS